MTQVTAIDDSSTYIYIRRSWPKKQLFELSFPFLPSIVPKSLSFECEKTLAKCNARLTALSTREIDSSSLTPGRTTLTASLESRCYANSTIIPDIFHFLVPPRATLLSALRQGFSLSSSSRDYTERSAQQWSHIP